MEKKENASKLISSLVALSLATTLGVPTIALADATGNGEGSTTAGAQQQTAEGENGAAPSEANETPAATQNEAAKPLPNPSNDGVTTIEKSGTYRISSDTTTSIVVNEGVTATIYIDSKAKLTNTAGKHTITNNGTLTITGSGTVDNVSHGKAAVENAATGKCTIESGTFTRSAEASKGGKDSGGNSYYVIENVGEMSLAGGIYKFSENNTGLFSSLIHNGWYDGEKNTTKANAIMHITGGTYTGGKITLKNDDYGVMDIDGNDVVVNETVDSYQAVFNVNKLTIKSGTFNSTTGCTVGTQKYAKEFDAGETTISGGSFANTGAIDAIYAFTGIENISITGGTFSDPGVYQYATSGNVDVTMGKDYSGQVVVPAGVASTLDLNGHKIQHTGTAVINNGTLTVQATNGGTVKSTGNCGIGVGNGSSTTINSGTVESQESSVITSKSCGATININGGTFTAIDNAVVAGNGSDREGNSNTININGGTFNGGITTSEFVACGIYAPWKDTVNVKGGTFNITNGAGIVARAGQVNVSGGTFNTTSNSTGKVGDSRVVVPCSALVFDADAKYPALTNQSAITVTGGTFSSEVVAIATVPDAGSSTTRVSVSGGTFSSDPTVYVASGYEAVKSGANWVVQVPYTPAPAPSTETTTTTNPDGTTTTTVTDKKTGESTSTTEGANGTTVVEKTDASGNTTTKVTVPEGAATNAGAPVEIPAAVEVTKGKEVSISAPAGTIVAIPAAADAGNVAVIVHADGTETVIPMSLVEGGKAIVKLDGDETIRIVDNAKVFSDVPAEHWAADDIDFASSHEIFKGIGNGDTYEPETALTRNMMMTVLARTDGADTSDSDPWYAKGQQWAVDNGVSNGLWGEDSITREQLVTMLFNYANKSGMDTSARADLSGMENADAVSDWATEAVQWAVAEGILKGVDNTDLAPQGLATRAQAAAFMQRYVKTALL